MTAVDPHPLHDIAAVVDAWTQSGMDALRGFTLLLLMQTAGELIARALQLPLPGPVLGLVLLLPCLRWPLVRRWVGPAAEFLLAHLSLLFVPIGVGVIAHLDLLAGRGLAVATTIVASTWVGLAVTAVVLRALLRRQAGGTAAAGQASGRGGV